MKALLAMLMFAMTGAAWAAGGTYDEDDPFDEARRFEDFERMGGNLAEEQDIKFLFTFTDRYETRAEHAQQFANKLKHRGYPKAEARPCGDEKACWMVTAPKRMRLDLKKNIALGKELDQLAADDYGHYHGWDCELFTRWEDKVLSSMQSRSNQPPPLGVWLFNFEQAVAQQCGKMKENLAGTADSNARSTFDMMCGCVPERLKSLRLGLQPAEGVAPTTEADVTQNYFVPKVIQPCAARMVRKMYGEECPAMAAERKLNAPSYCPCMQQLVNEMSEAELTQLGLAVSDYLPKVAQAKKSGAAPPDPPPLMAKFTASEAACRK